MDQLVALAAAGEDRGEAAGIANPPAIPPLFVSPWWLDAASAGKYETVTVQWDNRTVGALSFLRTRRLGMTCLRMPPYTRTLGPIITPPLSKPVQRSGNIRRIVNELLQRLPPHDEFSTTLDPAADPAIAFAFDVAEHDVCQAFTFRIDPIRDPKDVWVNLEKRTRNMIRSAGRRLTVMQSTDFARFERISRRERATEGTTHDYSVLRRLYEAASTRGQAMLYFATQEDGTDAAALILVWDAAVMYYWTSARDRNAGINGGNALLMWEGIQAANARGLIFDFDGYCSPGAARFLAGFAWEPVVRAVVQRQSIRFSLARLGQETLRRSRRKRPSAPADGRA